MLEAQDLTAVANSEEAAAKNTNGNVIAIAIGGAMLAVGAGLGYLLGNRKGVKKGEEDAKSTLMPQMDAMKSELETIKASVAS
jgi:hypothetical protein